MKCQRCGTDEYADEATIVTETFAVSVFRATLCNSCHNDGGDAGGTS